MTEESIPETLLEEARRWCASDPDPQTRGELELLLSSSDPRDRERLEGCFAVPLVFGTAGLRGVIGPGPAHFNVALIARLALALDRWLTARAVPGPVVIGFDARHKSQDAAIAAAGVLAALGRDVRVMSRPFPTPFLAFAARRLGAAGALMLTASHNPRTDNGVKVFGPDARQIVPPVDAELAELLAAVETLPIPSSGFTRVDDTLWEEYLTACAALVRSDPAARAGVRIAYTPLHGVGLESFAAVCARTGFGFASVDGQSAPDSDFPTTPFPNPEEPGVMGPVLALAASIDADLVLANDPDADRLAVAVRDHDGGYRMLTGDELGCVFLWFLLEHRSLTEPVASTIVSSDLPAALCADRGVEHHLTPTGFKWLSRIEGLGYAFEESIGYCVDPAVVSDKDGISAALLVADMFASGVDPLAVLERLDRRFGAHVQDNFSLRIDPERSAVLQEALLHATTSIAGLSVVSSEDLLHDPLRPGRGLRLRLSGPVLPAVDLTPDSSDTTSTDVVRVRVLVRPSGTEPKTKVYVEAVHPSRDVARMVARSVRSVLEKLAG